MVRVMSHNVWGMYARDVVKKVANRNELMKKVYFKYLPDVIGTQEFSTDIREHNLPGMLSPDYAELDLSRETASLGVANLFTPMFYRAGRLEVMEKGFHLYDRAFNNSDSKGVAYASFIDRSSGRVFSVCNTHFWWKPGPEHDAARVVNAKDILNIASRLPGPVIIMGDLNCTSSSDAYATLVAGGMSDVRHVAPETTDRHTHHPYPVYDEASGLFSAAPYESLERKISIDHIFIDNNHAGCVRKFEVLADDDSLTTSDHCPIFVDFEP